MNKITIKNLTCYCYHGCYEEEKKIGAEYKLDIWVESDFSDAHQSDNLHDTVDYVELADIAKREMDVSSKLIEHVASRILEKISKRWPNIKKAGLTIKKPSPPMNQFVDSVDYTCEI